MNLTKLKLSGFKSFIDPCELVVENGLTGIVGPNGCGKSNLVEALRWVMGENAPKRMRGGAMDDVIFGGTDLRPARNIAEVTLFLDNEKRDAPAAFNESSEIAITRRIDRGEGSTYLINGNEVRARDVQLLFADFATGAQSSAMVGQGRISDLVNAKPVQRRGILDEAAGITGLHARRHEAELRLRAAETNLERLEDVIGTLETQHQGLKRQARQAVRYRRVSESIRKTEALLLHLRWDAARTAKAESTRAVDEIERQVGTLSADVAQATTAESNAAAQLPALRDAEAEKSAALHRLAVARDRLDEEERQLVREQEEIAHRLAQIGADIEREEILAEDARAAVKRFDASLASLTQESQGDEQAIADALQAMEDARGAVNEAEDALARVTEKVATCEAERAALQRQIDDVSVRHARVQEQRKDIGEQIAALSDRLEDDQRVTEAQRQAEGIRETLERLRTEAPLAEEKRDEAERADGLARDGLQAEESKLARLHAERDAIADVLGHETQDRGPGIIDKVTVRPGYETALGAALGDDLTASEDARAPFRWASLSALIDPPSLPGDAEPLSAYVDAPRALGRRLSQIGLVTAEQGGRLQADLKVGQRLVSRDGALWRWDGYTVDAGAPTAAASRLTHRNRLSALEGECSAAEAAVAAKRADVTAAKARRDETRASAEESRRLVEETSDALATARERHAALAAAIAEDTNRLSGLEATAIRLDAEIEEAAEQLSQARLALDTAALPEAGRADMARLREALGALRTEFEERARAHDRVARAGAARETRLEELSREKATWTVRADGATSQLTELRERRTHATEAQGKLAARPAEFETQRRRLLDEIGTKEAERGQAADALAEAEQQLAVCEQTRKTAERALATAREERVRREGIQSQAEQAFEDAVHAANERLGVAPEAALELAELKEGAEVPDREAIESRLQRFTRERENIGPVNLRAEIEAAELDEQISMMISERADLEAAIARLRQGIGSLNREGRERILAAFAAIDEHFRDLFIRLFGGGQAHLALVDSDDPLEAGLDIMASPPGKKMQSLSLLSGGEKALTAVALLFAAFLTNPAPICVLDEVDAPLDDSNVDRFCKLISELAHTTETRFLVITHHRMTMSRVDRLFGVTMVERGVSQLVSVDLENAVQWRESA